MSRRGACVAVLCYLASALFSARELSAQSSVDTRVSILYTGRSLGAMGVRRWQDEHELLTEQANAENVPFKLVSHMAWRAPGIVVFMSGQEPTGNELPYILARHAEAERIDTIRALSSSNVVLFQDPWRPAPDLMAMLARNPRRTRDFPDLIPLTLSVSRMRAENDERVYIVEMPGAVWPTDPAGWTTGEMNRVDIADSRLFELPLNLGQLGPRATLLRRLRAPLIERRDIVLAADLGHAEADFGMTRLQRSRLDFTALKELDYAMLVPFEAELAMGAATLDSLRKEFPGLTMLAANVRGRDLMIPSSLINAGPVRIGFVGLVNPNLRDRLPRSALRDFTFEPAVVAAKREVAKLRDAGAHAIVVLSNMDPADNAALGESLTGIDAIIADLPTRWAPEVTHQRVELPDRPFARRGAPALIARSAANGVAVGSLSLEFHAQFGAAERQFYLAALEHHVEPVTDRTPPDSALVRRLAQITPPAERERGELMFPAFVDLANKYPALRDYDAITRQGRVSQPMWESFIARTLRRRANAEVAVIRRLDQFPPLIGKLHENEVDAWLWTEDQVVVMDVRGGDLRTLLAGDVRGELATSGISLARGTVQGHRLDDNQYYRVATVDVLRNGARSLGAGRRARERFTTTFDGRLIADRDGVTLSLKEFVLDELRRVRAEAKGDVFIDRIAAMLSPDVPFVSLVTFNFDRPTVFVSANEVRGRDGYGSVAESRVSAADSWVVGASSRFVLGHERQRSGTDYALSLAYGRQGVTAGGTEKIGESSDDVKFDITLRPSFRSASAGQFRMFARGLFDTEVTPTTDPTSGLDNPRQLNVRASIGTLMIPRPTVRRMEFALAVENDFGRPNVQYGAQAFLDLQRPVGLRNRMGLAPATYRMRNEATYFLPARLDSPSSLALRYNMVHELLVPLLDELSLSVAADVVMFQGKVPATKHLATSTLFRVGITYDRQWKPRYQPFL
jgi:hypothetical protein